MRCFSQITKTVCSTWRTTASLNNKQTPRTDFLTTDPPLEEDGSLGEGNWLALRKSSLQCLANLSSQDQSGEVCPHPNVLLMLINHITPHVKFHPYAAWLSNVPNRLADQPSQPVAYPSKSYYINCEIKCRTETCIFFPSCPCIKPSGKLNLKIFFLQTPSPLF